ncbi:hypothetical protein MA20_42920 [Bradyrhizobium japonicum]|uniref:Methyltransferase small domain-containing protein n=1 Tax=Bradyrhizobium japonicum TaxID=375 RepID=A0A0A3YJ15_BRAJP|nr:DUF3560 domain-containing protein [Bradyrhizobium japonicum]KGT73703.1 hypothetical protein MA20_42920 [Bradyrhizobium japonicum]
MTTYSATYSPDDNKLRLYASQRLDAETYARVEALGFKWAPKQELFVKPSWSPAAEDLLIELCGEIGDEDTSLVDRAEQRAERFEDYSEKRMADAERARKAVAEIADNIPFGRPILVGHHSEKHARRDKEKIDAGMRKAVQMWRTSQYWTGRAAGALAHAKYKELPEVRARRIKTIEAEKRKVERSKANAEKQIKAWQIVAGINDAEKQRAVGLTVANAGGYWSMSFPLADYPRDPPASQYEGPMGLWSAIDGNVITAAQAAAIAIPGYERAIPHQDRWIEHFENRLAYERAMLDEAGASGLLAPKPRRELPPLLNYRAPGGEITTTNMYDRGRTTTYPQVDMTKAEYARINKDYKGARWSADKSHRFRTAMVKHSLVAVYLTDSKDHGQPQSPAEFVRENVATPDADLDAALSLVSEIMGEPQETAEPAATLAPVAPAPRPVLVDALDSLPATADLPAASPTADFEAMRAMLKGGGVQVVVAPQLFPTSPELAAEVAELADIRPGHRILEPSAGTGALIEAARVHGAGSLDIVAIEINHQVAQTLGRSQQGVTIINADFMDMAGAVDKFDRIIMNPPFERGADIQHIEHARKFLKPGGRLVAICANGPRQRDKLMPIASEWRDLPAGSFKHAGTSVNTALLVIEGPPG